jgi:hypothetical protein
LEGHLIVPAAVIANNIKPFRGIFGQRRLFRTAFGTPLGRHHIALVEHFLFFFREKKDFLTLNTRNLDIRHSISS